MKKLNKVGFVAAALFALCLVVPRAAHAYTYTLYYGYTTKDRCRAASLAYVSSWTKIYQACQYDRSVLWYFIGVAVSVATEPDDSSANPTEPDDSSANPTEPDDSFYSPYKAPFTPPPAK